MDFVTTSHDAYQWPFPKPIVGRPCEPPSPDAKPIQRPPPVAPFCHCDVHAYSPKIEQYQQLLEREKKLCEDYQYLRQQMVDVTNDILDHPCDELDTKMQSMYQISYSKRTFPVVEYRTILPTQFSGAIPMEPHRVGWLRCYKDPTHFSENPPKSRPTIEPPGPVHTDVVPISVQEWFKDYPGRTEYMDNYSATAKSCWRSMQNYKEPLPSSRRRAVDRCI